MSGALTPAGGAAELVPGRIKPIAVAGFAVIAVGGALPGYLSAPAAAVAAGVAVAAAAVLVYVPRLPLLAAAVATAGLAVEADGFSSEISWLAACLLAGWCVIVVSQRTGLIYWAAIMILFTVEWLWIKPDPGWAAWLGGSTLTVLCALLIRHQIDLNARLREAQAAWPLAPGPPNATASPANCTTSSGTPWWSPCCTCRARGSRWSTTRPTPRGRWPRRSGWARSAWPRSG